MSEPFIGEIRVFGFNFPPRDWALCDGQLLPISQNTALFSLLGTTYGGDGRTTFGLPDLRGRVAIHPGQGPGLSDYRWGEKGGVENVTLIPGQIPSHNHPVGCSSDDANAGAPPGNYPASVGSPIYSNSKNANMNPAVIGNTGGSQSHTNVQPYLGVYHCIALQGIYPSRS